MKKLKVLVVDDHPIIRQGLRIMLDSSRNVYEFLTDEAESGTEGVMKIKKNNYDIVLMDFDMPIMNGAETTKAMLACNPNINILALSNYDENACIESILRAGAKGYVLKNVGVDELIKAISTILTGKNYYSNDVAIKLIKIGQNPSEIIKSHLSTREIEILKLIAQGHTSKEIADILFLSKRTIDQHRLNILHKMKVRNSTGMINQAKQWNIIA